MRGAKKLCARKSCVHVKSCVRAKSGVHMKSCVRAKIGVHLKSYVHIKVVCTLELVAFLASEKVACVCVRSKLLTTRPKKLCARKRNVRALNVVCTQKVVCKVIFATFGAPYVLQNP